MTSTPTTMVAYRMLEWEQPPQLVEVDVPVPGEGEVLVKVAGNGLCHSDITMMHMPRAIGEAIDWHMPFTLGHEVGGHIERVGAGVGGLEVGQAVALVSPTSCGQCWYCVRGLDSTCPNSIAGRGYGRDGGLAQYVVAKAPRDVIAIGSLDPRTAAPLTDAGATSYHAVKRVLPRLAPGTAAIVLGAGGLGAFAVQFLRALSAATVIAVDTNPARLDYVRELGAHETVTGVDESTAGELARLTNGEGAAAVLDFVGIDSTIGAGVAAVRPYGAYALIGSGGGKLRRPWGGLPRDAEVFYFQGSSISDAHDVVRLAEAGLVRSEADLYPLSRIEDAYDALDHGRLRGRAVVEPDG